MKKIILILFFIFSYQGFSQQISVLNLDTRFPLTNVTVYNEAKTTTAFSDVDGLVDLSGFKTDERIYFSHIGYISRRLTKRQILKKEKTVYLTQTSEELEEVVLSVSKWEQQKKDIPQKLISISAESITFTNPQTAADLLKNSGQVYIQKSQLGGGSPMIRGFATNRLLLSVDGVRMNNAIFRSGNVQNVISIDPFTIKKTEVIFGPGSVIFGSDAMGGVLNFYTKEAQLSLSDNSNFSGRAAMRYASANEEKTGNVSFNFGKSKWAFLSTITFSDFQDLKMGNYGPEDYLRKEYVSTVDAEDKIVANSSPRIQNPTGYHQLNLFQKIKFVPNDIWNFNLGIHYSETSDYDRYDRLISYKDEVLKNAEWYYGPQKWLMTNLQIGRKSESNLHDALKITVAYQFFRESRHDRKYQADILRNREEKVHAFSFNSDFEKRLSKEIKLFYGFEYVHNKVLSEGDEINNTTQESTGIQSRYPDGATWQTVAAYMNYEYLVKKNLTLLAGARYSHVFINADFDTEFYPFTYGNTNVNTGAFTGSIGMSWFPGKSWQVTLNGSTGFRAPNIDDVGKVFDSEPGAVVVPNPDLEAEYAYSGELGLKKNIKNKLFFSATTYYTYLVDALIRRDFDLNGETIIEYNGESSKVQAIQNAAKAYVYGFEFGLDYFFSSNLSFTSNVTITEGIEELEDGTNAPLRHAAPLFANAHMIWKNHKLKIDLFIDYNDEILNKDLAPSEKSKPFIYASDSDGNPYAPSWYTLNLKSRYQLSKNITTTVSIENITNQRYKPYSSGIAAAGSNFIVGISCDF